MEKRFNIGDKVTYLPDNMQGEITAVHSRGLYSVKYPDDEEIFTVNESNLEFVDAKRALGERLCLLGDQFSTESNPIELIKADFADGVSVAYRHTDTTDRKILFLRQLQRLLREYDAVIGAYSREGMEEVDIVLSVGEDDIKFSSEFFSKDDCPMEIITADNIMNVCEE